MRATWRAGSPPARWAARLWGALCGVVAVTAAALLDEQPELYLPYGVMVLTLTGAVGGLFGQLDAVIKKFLKTLQ